MSSVSSARLKIYQAWVQTWLRGASAEESLRDLPPLTVSTMAYLLQDENLYLLQKTALLCNVVASFKWRFQKEQITLGGTLPPSSEETNLLSERYDPRVECTCDGTIPIASMQNTGLEALQSCRAIERMRSALTDVVARHWEWNGHDLFTIEKLLAAVEELTLCNSNANDMITICSGSSVASIPPIYAPDRRPSTTCDSDTDIFNKLFPTLEKIKLCADAKYFHAMACGGGLVDEGLLHAIADAGNDVLIGDYCEAATPDTLHLLQRAGAAAMAFLKINNVSGALFDWQ